ncbi:universal stress protein [Halalkalicoccus sp. NIPERK01]|uniref:universal stress protein n=1 Tax=Halalkalicoccus sp. NIPERK01 TaxID=3053469 RepID=UPI00256ED5CB|nr:universal stress protein [Halalkalicoccus sp. NIPERK01]MDL5363460.1 universal stress protein [Halalkalicoccus sp. NIPERK01]
MTIVAAIDIDDNAERIVSEAAELATAFDEDLHVVHVRELSELKQGPEGDAAVDRRSVQQQVRDEAARVASAITDDFTPIGLIGKPASEVVSYAASQDATYLVIGGTKQSPVGKAVFGNTTQQILLNAPCPVVTTPIAK